MSFLPKSRTKRRLIKVASLGLAGLLAGLLSACNDTQAPAASSRSEISTGAQSNPLPPSIEATQIPALRHPPSSRSLQLGTVHTVSQASFMPSRSHS
jgi:hypothetical protein